ncbi:MAG: 3-deoxy-D-manno-octulosonic acid transferase [Deltaproteobacteria bacterium]|nr:3-deoxy-D-manno-octulosonic acid transferase [Deltaproteobacteria bacterium]
MEALMMRIYSIIYGLVLSIYLPMEFFKRPGCLRLRWLMERLGVYPSIKRNGNNGDAAPERPAKTAGKVSPVIWIHAVSVGETLTAVPLVKAIVKNISPNVVLTTVTDTGRKIALERLSKEAGVLYVPFDLPSVVDRAMRRIKPDVFIVMETEMWPNLFSKMKEANVPVVILNGRLSDRSYRGYRKIRFFMEEVLSAVVLFGMQNETYAARAVGIGADSARVKTLGNLKFDMEPPPPPSWTHVLSSPLLVAGSTHEGEEELVASVYLKLKKEFPGLSLILAPRHPERFLDAIRAVERLGLPCVRRSGIDNSAAVQSGIVVLDTIGELSSVYGAADVCIMGGSFVPKGGHNLLEPASWGKAIVCGPHMDNFPMTGEFIDKGAVFMTKGSGLYDSLKKLLSGRELRVREVNVSKTKNEKNAVALDRSFAEITAILNSTRT